MRGTDSDFYYRSWLNSRIVARTSLARQSGCRCRLFFFHSRRLSRLLCRQFDFRLRCLSHRWLLGGIYTVVLCSGCFRGRCGNVLNLRINCLRCDMRLHEGKISLFYLGPWTYTAFEWFPLYLWQALILLDALVVWLIW